MRGLRRISVPLAAKQLPLLLLAAAVFLQGARSDPEDELCLTGLAQSLQDPGRRLVDWNNSTFADPCNGFTSYLRGVTCNNGRIFKLALSNLSLGGSISPSVAYCTNLQTLDLSSNALTGTIPQDLQSLVNLAVLNLSGNRLSGVIPPQLALCAFLNVIDLHDNRLTGQIPQQLGLLVRLSGLNVSNNKLSGPIPASLGNRNGDLPRFNASSFQGNKHLYGYPLPGTKSKGLSVWAIVGIGLGSGTSTFLLLAVILGVIPCRSGRLKKEASFGSSAEDHHPKLPYAELSQATGGFSQTNVIGEGSFGVVYKGILPSNGQTVAVKVLKLQEKRASKSFMAECEALRTIRHRNLIKTITSCSGIDFRGEDFKALVFEFMPNGSLENWLHHAPEESGFNNSSTRLSVGQRLNIAIDVAAALDYLHHQCETPIAHCDLKPSNVLLDTDFTAHLSDFGLAKFLMARASAANISSVGLRGTVGYVAPEYGVGGAVSTRGDVYSFGILLLELFTGKRPTEPSFGDNFSLRESVDRSLPHGLYQVLDPVLCLGEVQNDLDEVLVAVLQVGLMCSVMQPKERMDIREAASALRKAQAVVRVGRS